MRKFLFCIPILILLLSIAGCEPQKPYFEKEKVKAEPSFLRPNDATHNQLILLYTIKNPTTLDFQGKVSYKFSNDCVRIDTTDTQVTVAIGKDNAYSVQVSTPSIINYKNECYGTQNILLVLSNKEGIVVYDSQNVEISVTQ